MIPVNEFDLCCSKALKFKSKSVMYDLYTGHTSSHASNSLAVRRSSRARTVPARLLMRRKECEG
jgi:hypothetical protein